MPANHEILNIRSLRRGALVLSLLVLFALGFWAVGEENSDSADALRSPDSFTTVTAEDERSVALFLEAGKVLLHPRCVNCHPSGDRPRQGDEGALHQPPVTRGEHNEGVVGMQCSTCHHTENFNPGRVPGAPNWHLAPREMAWEGKSLGEICEQIKDPVKNGGRDLEQIVHHMSHDGLVGWAWEPGADREPAPGTQETFADLIRAWAETGAACP